MSQEKKKTPEKAENRDEELDRLRLRRSELVGAINQNEKTSSETVASIEEDTAKIVDEYSKDADALRLYGNNIRTETEKALRRVSKEARDIVGKSSSYFTIYLIVVISVLASVGLLGGYLLAVYIPDLLEEFILIWASASALTAISLWYLPALGQK